MFAMIMAASVSLAQETYEAPPTVRASDLVPQAILTGEDYTIDPDVATDGFMGRFQIRSKFGDFECIGREMLATRLAELRALKELEQVSKTKVFLDAVKGAVEEPVQAAVKIITRPVGSARAVPRGVAHLFKDVVEGMVDTGRSVGNVTKIGDKGPKPPPSREDPLGYNKIRDEWAKKLAVDPYTTNRVLAVKMNHLATIGFGTDKVAGAGVGFGLGGLGVIGDYVSWLPDVDEHLLTAPSADVDKENARRLEALGVSKQDMKPLLKNDWFTPTLQIRFVNALVRLKGAGGIGIATQLAGGVQSEEEARFLCASLEMLQRYHANNTPVLELAAHAGMPVGLTGNGTLVAAAPIDVMTWNETSAEFATRREGKGTAILCTNGILTQRAQEGFKKQGWQVIEFSRSSP